ncbi:Rne/Rng family ribonuclease [Rubripirellula amarantea]|uniref:Ribonuclease G n=1 Tax=Rubripirellula amarantea TaxID=2527999 RepID=A0A5C5WL11_9BACT|nr:Rne/Rng family ribonuclease [Rubripirellula amarantea]MDA8746246.1 Rne/Rng family ribonuclease [Rubripirellula amarantea]TWT50741.1 Ribonuclease E [Rubripirellula amarantea]
MKKEMLINVLQPEECRIAVLENGRLEELYVERKSVEAFAGNIYRGKIVNLEPSIQAAFVDFGVGRNGFLHISDVEPQYFRQGGYDPEEIMRESDEMAEVAAKKARDSGRGNKHAYKGGRPRNKPPIQEIFKRGDEVLVQVIKEGIGTKGPTLSTYISIPGRYLVLMPSLARVGVSRKIEDEDDRKRLKRCLRNLNPPKGLGFIVRTAGAGRTEAELGRDMDYLLRLWKAIVKRIEETPEPGVLYEESDLIIRTIRDIYTDDIDQILIDEKESYDKAKTFLNMVMPRVVDRLKLFDGDTPLFHSRKLEQEIVKINQRQVHLKEGGSIVIDPTEALVAIDVNSGNFRSNDSAEENAFRLNMAAAKEIARQLRLRDLGGVIVNDFIDMRKESHRRKVERVLRDAMANDRARTKILRTSPFGLIEMTRQRVRPSLKRSIYRDCPCCEGRALVKTAESMSIEVIRTLALAVQNKHIQRVTIRVNDEVAAHLNNRKRREVMAMEDEGGMTVQILGSEALYPEHLELDCRDAQGERVEVDS